jgi:hypothetical protein
MPCADEKTQSSGPRRRRRRASCEVVAGKRQLLCKQSEGKASDAVSDKRKNRLLRASSDLGVSRSRLKLAVGGMVSVKVLGGVTV